MKSKKEYIQQMIKEMIYYRINSETIYELINIGYSDLVLICNPNSNWLEVYSTLNYILNDGVPNENMNGENSIKYVKNVINKIKGVKFMKKSDLKTGMILEFNNGAKAMVLLGTENGDIFSGTTWGGLYNLNEDLKDVDDYSVQDVNKIYQPKSNMRYLFDGSFDISECELLWERPIEGGINNETTN